ncbi:MAG: AAA family ATPase [Tepidiformaceae bacterium]
MSSGNFPPSNHALILLSGLPGAGKTTFARALASVLSFEHIESDAIRRELAAHPLYTAAENAAVFARAEARAASALQAGRVALLDSTALTNRDRKRFVALARRAAVPYIAVRVTAPDDVVRARLAHPREGFSQATVAIFERMRARPQPFAVPAVVVDTRFPLGPAIDLLVRLVHDQGA